MRSTRLSTKEENAAALREEDDTGLMETRYLSAIPAQRDKLIEGLHTPLEDCLPENEVEW